MVNSNGTIEQEATFSVATNRGFLFGDSVFETIRTLNNKVLFLEDHYFRLMASMRICRMEIPMQFTMEYFESQILSLIQHSNAAANRVRFSVFRIGDGFYLPSTNEVEFLVTFQPLENELYIFNETDYEVELFKDSYVTKQLLSTLKTNNKMVQITGSVFAHENGYQNCLLLNDDKNVVEALQGNLFMKMNNQLITPPIADGCLNGIMRKQILTLAKKVEGLEVIEKSISPFDLQKADELFVTNVIQGVQSITKYRKKTYENSLAKELHVKLNALVRLS
ncbi:aminotransferase class IV [Flavobacterium tibetense]|uniref:branched-chain-amino-acid transaminase n=1 Tax=Flavobacterium tibetense TaxID=2233533 RepID=A0A365P3Z2_9FLAO|nr:aminotransferase class IV [Flavobacterium tibetense]RBA29255.1 aminotransferase class IV [Flavobacterium tibetense]